MTDSPNDPAGAAGPADPDAPGSARHQPIRRLARAMVSPDSYGSVLLLNVVLLIVVGAGGLSTQRLIWRRLRPGPSDLPG